MHPHHNLRHLYLVHAFMFEIRWPERNNRFCTFFVLHILFLPLQLLLLLYTCKNCVILFQPNICSILSINEVILKLLLLNKTRTNNYTWYSRQICINLNNVMKWCSWWYTNSSNQVGWNTLMIKKNRIM